MLRDLTEREEKTRTLDRPLAEEAASWADEYRLATRGKRHARNAKGLEVLMAYLGKTKGVMNSTTGLWEQIVERAGETWASVPLFAALLRSIMKESTKSQPLYGYRGDFADTNAQRRARFATSLVEYLNRQWFYPEADQEDVLWAIAFGFGGAELRWDPRAGEEHRLVPVTCPRCQTTGHVYETEAKHDIPCPDERCQASAAEARESVPMMQKGERLLVTPAGDVALERFSPFAFSTNGWATRNRPAVWSSIDDILDRAVWDELHENCAIEGAWSKPALGDDLRHLRQQRSFEQAQMGSESSRYASRARNELLTDCDVVRRRDFFAPSKYRRVVTRSEDETLPSGRVIEGGTKVVEQFPDGFCLLRRGDEVVDIYPCRPRREIRVWNFSVKPGDAYGAATAAQALEAQYNMEEDLSHLQATAAEMTGTRFYDSSLFDARTGSHPSGKHPVNFRQLYERGLKVGDLIYDSPPANPSPVVFQLVLFYEQRMEGILGTFGGTGGGLPSALGKTATANMRASNESQSQQGMYLMLRAFFKLECFEEGVEVFRENADLRRAISMGGPFADGAVVFVDRTMLPERFNLELKEDSWWPRDRGQKQQAELTRYNLLMMANQAAMMLHGRPLDATEERYINEVCGSEVGMLLTQIGAELAADEWSAARAFLRRQIDRSGTETPPTEEDAKFLEAATATLREQAEAAAREEQKAALVASIGAEPSPMGAPGGDAMPVEMADPMAEMGGGVPVPGEPGGAGAIAPAAVPPITVPPPDPLQVMLAATDLAVPIRPGLTPSFRAMAAQLRLEALKTETRELPDVYLQWLDSRAQTYDQMARDLKAVESGAVGPGADPSAAPMAGAPGGGAGQPIAEALLTKLAAIQGGGADALGLPGSAPLAGEPAPTIGSGYGPS